MESREADSKFSMLFKPIRDLADNWNIDVAAELEEYLEDLESVVISFNGGQKNLNFAEAALMIQGSAVVYSKKVEFLYNLVFETLELLSKQKKQKGDGSKEKALLHLVMDDPVIVLDNSIFGERENIDLKPDDKEIQRRTAMLNSSKRYSVLRLYESNMGIISSNLSSDNKDKSFFLSRCSISPVGQFTIGTGNNTSLLLPTTPRLTITATSMLEEKENDPSVITDVSSMISGINNQSSILSESVVNQSSLPQQQQSDDDAYDELPEMDIHETTRYNDEPRQESRGKRSLENLWRLEDPYDVSGNRSQPYSRGKVLLDRNEIKKKNDVVRNRKQIGSSVVDYSNPADLLFCCSNTELDVFSHSSSCIKELLRKQISQNRMEIISRRRHHSSIVTDDYITQQDGEDNGPDPGDFLDIGFNDLSDDELVPNLQDEAALQMELENTRLDVSFAHTGDPYTTSMSNLLNQTTVFDPLQFGDVDVPTRIDSNQTLIPVGDGEYMTYEDLCRQHMEKFMHGVEQFTRETKLVKRVNEWERRIVPMLEEQDRHEQFDIRKDREMLIDEIKEKKKKKEEDVVIMELTVEKAPYEVSRMFVSLLQMANDGNVKIVTSGKCNDMEIRLLSDIVPAVSR